VHLGALPLKGLMNQNIQECDHIPNVMKSTSWEWQRLIGPQDMLLTGKFGNCTGEISKI
jgi:hypothetical protein